MQKKKGLPGVTLRCFAVCLGIITGMISTNSVSAQGTVVCSSGDCYSCQLHATSVHNPIGTTIYDDGLSNWGTGCTYAPGTNNGAWNCARSFLFTEYIGTNDTIQLTFKYAGPELCSSPTDSGYHDLYIYNNTRGELLTPSPIVIADLDDSSFLPTVYILPSIYTTTPGELQLSFFRHNHNRFGIDQPDITGRIILIPQIQQFWITANPICSDFSVLSVKFSNSGSK